MRPLALDEEFDEPPGVVSTILCSAIQEAGWKLVGVWDSGQRLVWTVEDDTLPAPTTVQAVISAQGRGSIVSVSSLDELWRDPREPWDIGF